jgi:hypothetical protein
MSTSMKYLIWFLTGAAVCALLAPSQSLSGEPQGTFEVCRKPNITTDWDHRAIQLAPGTRFADITDAQGPVPTPGNYRMVRLTLLQALTIPVGARCATAPATVSSNPSGFPVGPNQHRLYQFSGGFQGSMAEMVGYAKSDFR